MRDRTYALLGAVAALVLALGVASAWAGSSGSTARHAAAAGGASAPQIDLRIGVVAPLTGNLSSIGPGQVTGSKVALKVINDALKKNGVAGRVKVTIAGVEDTQGDSVPAVQAASKLATTSNIDVLVGSCATRETLAIAQSVTVRQKILQVSMCSSAPELSNLKDNGFVWQMIYPNTLLATAFVKAAQAAFGKTATLNTGSINDAGNGGFRKAFDAAWKAAGGKIGQSVAWNLSQPTYDTEAQKIASGEPAGWVLISTPEDWKKLGPALVRAGSWSPARTFVIEVFKDPAVLNDLGDEVTKGLRGVSPTNEGSSAKAAFDRLFKKYAPKAKPTGFDSLGFDPVIVSFLAALRAKSDNPAVIKRHMVAVSGPPGVKIKPNQLALAVKRILAGKEIDYEGGWGNLDWNAKGDPGASLFEVWQYPGGGADVPAGKIIKVTSGK